MAYPLDIDTKQDHFKITKYKYARPNINQRVNQVKNRDTNMNVAGDSVIVVNFWRYYITNAKATDANAAGWGGSDLTATDLGWVLLNKLMLIQWILQDFLVYLR